MTSISVKEVVSAFSSVSNLKIDVKQIIPKDIMNLVYKYTAIQNILDVSLDDLVQYEPIVDKSSKYNETKMLIS